MSCLSNRPFLRFAAFSLGFASCLAALPAAAQTLEDGLDNPAPLLSVTTGSALLDETDYPAGEWAFTTGTTHDGVDAITSTLPNRSTSQLNATVQGPATVSFWWRTSGGDTLGFDTFQFSSRNSFGFINGNTDWQQRSFQVDTGSESISWFFERNSSFPVNVARAWLDELVVTPILNNPALQEAMENFAYTFHSTDWTSGSLDGAINTSVAKSGVIQPNQKSDMVFEIVGPATVRFRWGITADSADVSTLALRVGNQTERSLSGPQPLTEDSLDLGPGTHPMKFSFTRGNNTDPDYMGMTEGFIDNLTITPVPASAALADAIERPDGVYSDAWTRQTLVIRDGSDAAMVTAPELSVARRLYVELPDEAGLFSFWYKTEADPGIGYLRMIVDGEIIEEVNGVNDWTKIELNLAPGFDRVFEAFFYRISNPNGNSPNTKAYLDEVTFIPGATNFQPDLSIGPLKKGLKGVGVYNASGAGQIATIRAPLTRPVGEYAIRAQNGSISDQDTILLRGVGSRRHFQIFYVVEEGGQKLNFSAAFAAGIFETTQLGPKASEAHEVWIVRKRRAVKKRSYVLQVIGTSDGDSHKIDVVRTKLVVKRR